MIRKTLLLMVLTLGAISAYASATDDEDISVLKTTPIVNVKIDFSNADVENYSSEQFAQLAERLNDTIMSAFLSEMNKKLGKFNIKFSSIDESLYLILIQVLSIEEDGAVKSMVTVVDLNTVSQVANFKLKAHGGMFGGFEQLFVEGMARLGENLGDHILEKFE